MINQKEELFQTYLNFLSQKGEVTSSKNSNFTLNIDLIDTERIGELFVVQYPNYLEFRDLKQRSLNSGSLYRVVDGQVQDFNMAQFSFSVLKHYSQFVQTQLNKVYAEFSKDFENMDLETSIGTINTRLFMPQVGNKIKSVLTRNLAFLLMQIPPSRGEIKIDDVVAQNALSQWYLF